MKRIELILVTSFITAVILKSFLMAFGDTLTGFALTFLGIFYFVCSVPLLLNIPIKKVFSKEAYSGISTLRIVGTFGIANCLSIVTIGLMFKLLLLPGSGAMLNFGLTGLTIITLVATIKIILRGDRNFYYGALLRLIPALMIGFFFHKTPTNEQVAFFYRDNPEFIELYEQFYNDPTNRELNRQVQEALMEME